MNRTELRKQLNLALKGICFGFSKVKDTPDEKFYAGVFMGLMTALKGTAMHIFG